MEEKSNKGKGLSIAIIILTIVIGFGFVIGLTQTSAANSLKTEEVPEIAKYAFDENGTLLSYGGDLAEIVIPETYSLSSTVEEVSMTSNSLSSLVERARNLGIKKFNIENQSGSYKDEYGNTFYQDKFILTYSKRKTIEGTDYKVTGIGASAFSNNNVITSVALPETIKTIGNNAFNNCTRLRTINLPEGLERIEYSAFNNCYNMEDITLPNTIMYIGSQAFQNCDNLTTITIPTSMYEITDMCFYNCDKLTTVNIPSNIRNIYSQAFYYCRNLVNLNLAEGLQNINDMAFQNCRSLQSVVLPSTLTYMGNNCFYNCTNLRTVILNGFNIPEMNGLAFSTSYINKIYVEDTLFDNIRNYGNWSSYYEKFAKISEL